MEYLVPAAFLAATFFLGAVIMHLLRARSIETLKLEAQEAQSRFYKLQDVTRKDLSEKDAVIMQLRQENHKEIATKPMPRSLPKDLAQVETLQKKNTSLEEELKSLKTRIKELKVEKAVHIVDKKYPMQLYGMDGDKPMLPNMGDKKNIQMKGLPKETEMKKVQSQVVFDIDDGSETVDIIKSKKDPKKKGISKHKKSKKKSKSKKGRSKVVLALFENGNKGKKTKNKKKGKSSL